MDERKKLGRFYIGIDIKPEYVRMVGYGRYIKVDENGEVLE